MPKITTYPAATAIIGSDVFYLVNGVISKKVTAQILANGMAPVASRGVIPRSEANRWDDFLTPDDFASNTTPGVTDMTAAIQAAMDTGFCRLLPNTIYLISNAGVHDGFAYGLMLRGNLKLMGPGSGITTIKVADGSNMVPITDDRTVAKSNIGLSGFTIDGNSSNNTGADNINNLWLKNLAGLVIDDIVSFDPAGFGMRFDAVTKIRGGTIEVDGEADGQDGIHFYDCSDVEIDKVIIDTVGDDAFVITAENDDAHDFTIGELIITAPVTGGAAGRGVMLNLSDVADAAATQRSIYNIRIPNVVTKNCKGPALHLHRAQFRNVNIGLSDYGSKNGLDLNVGSANVTGYVRSCHFDIQSWEPTGQAVAMSITDGVIEYSSMHLQSYNPADAQPGATIQGDYWENLTVQMDYDPNGTKVSPSHGIDVYASYSSIHANVDGADVNVNFRAAAQENTLYLGRLQNAVTRDLGFAPGSNNNRVIGGGFTGSVLDQGTGNQFFGVKRGHNYGSTSISPDANGNGTITHGLASAPDFVTVGIRGDNVNGVDVESVDGTNIVVRIKDAAGADVTASSFTIDWEVRL